MFCSRASQFAQYNGENANWKLHIDVGVLQAALNEALSDVLEVIVNLMPILDAQEASIIRK